MRRGWIGAAGLVLAACQLNSSGFGSSSAVVGGGTTGDTATGDTATGGTQPDDADSTTGPGDSGDGPQLIISGDPFYDFGRLAPDMERTSSLTVRNAGGGVATGLRGSSPGDPFTYAGGTFPGTEGDCGPTLEPGGSCVVAVTFAPRSPGDFDDLLVITCDQGPDATRSLRGTGHTDNLLANPGGEEQGNPPPGWIPVGQGAWVAGDPWDGQPPVFEGQGYLGAYTANGNQELQLYQQIDVSSWTDAIDQGSVRLTFEGHARSLAPGDDDYRLQVQYRDGQGQLDAWTTDWVTTGMWQQYQYEGLMPPGTRQVRVVLWCRKQQGGQYCDAFFDELDLRATGSGGGL